MHKKFHFIVVNDCCSTHQGILESTILRTDRITTDGISLLIMDIDRKCSLPTGQHQIFLFCGSLCSSQCRVQLRSNKTGHMEWAWFSPWLKSLITPLETAPLMTVTQAQVICRLCHTVRGPKVWLLFRIFYHFPNQDAAYQLGGNIAQ